LYGDRGRDSIDTVKVGSVHLFQELSGIGGERLDIASLALGINGVERQTRLAGTAHAAYDSQLIARYIDIDILEVMNAYAAKTNFVIHT